MSQAPTRRALGRVLVVCEDTKSSRLYLWSLLRDLRLTAIDIVGPDQTGHTDPPGIVEWAIEQRGPRRKPSYDHVWVVFDRDQHEVAGPIDRAHGAGLRVAFSNPCWEIWIVAHFDGSTRPRHRDDAFAEAKRHVPAYSKGADPFAATWMRVGDAIRTALVWRAHHRAVAGDGNPSTGFDELVCFLRGDQANRPEPPRRSGVTP